MMSRGPAKVRRTETPGQAAHFQRMLNKGLGMGLCHACAAQLAYGRQHGVNQVKPPCSTCYAIAAEKAPRWAYAQDAGASHDTAGGSR